MNEADVSRLRFDLETGNEMPARMSIVAFSAFPNLNSRLNLQPNRLAAFLYAGLMRSG